MCASVSCDGQKTSEDRNAAGDGVIDWRWDSDCQHRFTGLLVNPYFYMVTNLSGHWDLLMLNAALTEAYFLLCSNFLQPKLYTAHVHFNLSLSIYFNTALIVTCLWLFWYQTKLLLDAKMRREESQIRNNVVTFVGWGLLWCSAPDIPRVLTDIPWRSVAPVLIYACQPLLLPPRSIT